MLNFIKCALTRLGFDTSALYQNLFRRSILAAIKEQDLEEIFTKLREIVPDLRQQYTSCFDEEEFERYWEIKLRGVHAWQVGCFESLI